MKALTSLATC